MSAARSHKPLPVAEWPVLDREAWSVASDAGDEVSGWPSRWAPRSRENAEMAHGRFLGFLERSGRLRAVTSVGDRLVFEDLCAFGRQLSAQLAPFTVLGIFSSLSMAVEAMDPKADRGALNHIRSRLAQAVRSVRDIAGNLLSPKELVTLGTSMMDEAEQRSQSSWRRASLYRDGLLIMFMALCPLRPGAVAEMRLGTHVSLDGNLITVRLPPRERAKRRIENIPLTDQLATRFLRYLEHYRLMFPDPAPRHADAVWISRNGAPLSRDSLSKRIKERVGRRTGKRFTAHMFRHACATYIVDVAPERALMIVGVLGHSGFRTAQDYYIKGQQHFAIKNYQGAVSDLMRRHRRQIDSHGKRQWRA